MKKTERLFELMLILNKKSHLGTGVIEWEIDESGVKMFGNLLLDVIIPQEISRHDIQNPLWRVS